MNKKSFMFLFAFIFSLILVGCNKQKINSEFNDYKEKVINVMEDYGAKVNKSTEPSQKNMSKTYENSKNDVWSLIINEKEKEDLGEKAFRSYFEDCFDQTFYIPLILGEALSIQYNATEFYGVNIKAEEWNQTIKTSKDGDVITTVVFQPNAPSYQADTYVVIELDYKSGDNYSFKALQFDESLNNRLFIYGDNNKNFIFAGDSLNREDNEFISYKENNGNFYQILNKDTVKQMFDFVSNEFTSINANKIKSDAESAKYIINKESYQQALEIYYPGRSSMDVGFLYYDDILCYGYGAAEFEKSISIPSGTKMNGFEITDYFGSVKELVFPANMEITDINGFFVKLQVRKADTSSTIEPMVLEKITVEEGNPYFSIRNGNLCSKDGTKLYYVVDSPNIEVMDLRYETVAKQCIQNSYGYRKYLNIVKSLFLNYDSPIDIFRDRVGNYNVHIESVEIYGISSDYGIISDNFFRSGDTVDKLVFHGSYDQIYINDSIDVIKKVELKSTNTDAKISDGSRFNGELNVSELVISQNGTYSVSKFQTVKKVIVNEGVTEASCNFQVSINKEIDIYLSKSILSFMLPNLDYGQSKPIEGNYRVHIPYSTVEVSLLSHDIRINGISLKTLIEQQKIQEYTLLFNDLSEEELKIKELTSSFKDTKFNDSLQTASLAGFATELKELVIPEALKGYTITEVNINLDFSREFPFARYNLEKLTLPKTLKSFTLSQGKEYLFIKSISYDGTMSQFKNILKSELNTLKSFVLAIKCSDGIISQNEIVEKYTYVDVDNPSNKAICIINWTNDSGEVEFHLDGKLIKGKLQQLGNYIYYAKYDNHEMFFSLESDKINNKVKLTKDGNVNLLVENKEEILKMYIVVLDSIEVLEYAE